MCLLREHSGNVSLIWGLLDCAPIFLLYEDKSWNLTKPSPHLLMHSPSSCGTVRRVNTPQQVTRWPASNKAADWPRRPPSCLQVLRWLSVLHSSSRRQPWPKTGLPGPWWYPTKSHPGVSLCPAGSWQPLTVSAWELQAQSGEGTLAWIFPTGTRPNKSDQPAASVQAQLVKDKFYSFWSALRNHKNSQRAKATWTGLSSAHDPPKGPLILFRPELFK